MASFSSCPYYTDEWKALSLTSVTQVYWYKTKEEPWKRSPAIALFVLICYERGRSNLLKSSS